MKAIFITTKGFKDLTPDSVKLENNPFIFNMLNKIELFETIIEVDEAINTNGMVIKELIEQDINKALRQIFMATSGQSIFIAFINSCRNPLHEIIFENLLRTSGYNVIYSSHRLDDLEKYIKLI